MTVVLAAPATSYAADERLVGEVEQSIKKGVSFLKSQANDGNWENHAPHRILFPGGTTSLAVIALINSGESVNGRIVQDALEYLRKIPPKMTYVVGLQTMAFVLAKDPKDKSRIQDNLRWLEERLDANMKSRGDKGEASGWGYNGVGVPDHSINQYALLGIYEAMRAGYMFDKAKLELLHNYYKRMSHPVTGGFGYRSSSNATVTMTTAGLCNMYITQRAGSLSRSVLDLQNGQANQTCGLYDEHKQIGKALDFLAKYYPGDMTEATLKSPQFPHPFYALYGIERAGRLSGRRFFGDKDWYRIGCRALVDAQETDGSWGGYGRRVDYGKVVSSSFSLLFLSKGRTPVLITKIAFGNDGGFKPVIEWNRKRDDLRFLTDYVSRELFDGNPLAWQIFDVRKIKATAPSEKDQLAEELLACPIVYLSGHDLNIVVGEADKPNSGDLNFQILKRYVENGGFIVAEACCGSEKFTAKFTELAEALGGGLTDLGEAHGVWHAAGDEYAVKAGTFPLKGVQKGCKTIMIFNPGPNVMSGFWNKDLQKDGLGKEAFKMGANIVAYATGLEKPKPRLTTVKLVRKGDDTIKPPRGYLQVVQLKLRGGDDQPAPKAVSVLMNEMSKLKLEMATREERLFPGDNSIENYRFFYVHGRGKFAVPQVEELEGFKLALEDGGVLLADAACGDAAFDKQFRLFVKQIWPDKDLEPIKLEPNQNKDELFSEEINGQKITADTLRYRRKDKNGKLSKKHEAGPPQLLGIKIYDKTDTKKQFGRWAVIYSPLDIGCALEKHTATDCYGYDHESAKILGRAVVMYALRR